MKAHKVILCIIDFDELGADDVAETLINANYPNDCISPTIISVDTKDIGEWSDDHPLNNSTTSNQELERIFQSMPACPVVALGDKRFQFDSYEQWVGKAQSWFISADLSSRNTICLDAKGRICDIGRDFKAAELDGAYPVTVYEKRPS